MNILKRNKSKNILVKRIQEENNKIYERLKNENKEVTRYSDISAQFFLNTYSPNNIIGHLYNLYRNNKYNDFRDKLDNEMLENIFENINNFVDILKKFEVKKILLICSDYPGYGGAATNCHNLQQFFLENEIYSYSVFWNWQTERNKKYETNKDYTICDENELESKLKKLHFAPDIIILKNSINKNINLLNIWKSAKIIFLVPGVFHNHLNQDWRTFSDYTVTNNFINNNIIDQINHSHLTLCNSTHTRIILRYMCSHLLRSYVRIGTFYSTFVPYLNKKITIDSNFINKKYDYGLIISDFNRPIKNAECSIKFLKDKQNVILIGKNSSKYEKYGFDCIENVSHKNMINYYKKIKCIVQHSFYESCSNVKIESLFNGCLFINNNNKTSLTNLNEKYPFIKYYELDISKNYEFEKKKYYIIGNITHFYNSADVYNLFIFDKINAYVINNTVTNNLIFFIYLENDLSVQGNDLYKLCLLNKESIGVLIQKYSTNELIDMYYNFGKYNIDKTILGISLFYDEYINNKERKYNKQLYLYIYSYYYGNNDTKEYIDKIKNSLNDVNLFHSNSALIISKSLVGYGGVQKTTRQLVQLLDKKYNIDILSARYLKEDGRDKNDDDYEDFLTIMYERQDYYSNYFNLYYNINYDFPNCFLIKTNHKQKIEQVINNTNYEIIVNNKLNNVLEYDIKKQITYICHNSMDPLNKLILTHESKIDKLLVINNFHKNLLINNGFNKPIFLYNNYVNVPNNVKASKNEFNFNIAFIGRITKEKNVQLLIDGVNLYNKKNVNITLFIIGDGDEELVNLNSNIKLMGRLDFSEIVNIYKKIDYVISASVTEGKPFSILEALCYGIPCIHSNINGIDEIITNNINGYTFDLNNYETIKYDMTFDNLEKIFDDDYKDDNMMNIKRVLKIAYNSGIKNWNKMSQNSNKFMNNYNSKEKCENDNLSILENKKTQNKEKIFINFKPNQNISYGGGNIFTSYINDYLSNNYSITYELDKNIKIFLIIDPFKDTNFKKYSLLDVINYKNKYKLNSKIIVRVNDCDVTRDVVDINKSRENEIIKNHEFIDYYIFNSHFIKNYYIEKFKKQNIVLNNNYKVIVNGCDQTIFKNLNIQKNKHVNIVTHHWSNNINKGYNTYLRLWNWCKDVRNKHFAFIGKNIPEMFREVPIDGPFHGNKLNQELNKYQIYITDSKNDSCPNHVLEAISAGLPVLYSNVDGGAKELCEMAPYPVGEIYHTFKDMTKKIDKIINNYSFYTSNIKKSLYVYNINTCINKYNNSFLLNLYNFTTNIKLNYKNNILKINSTHNNNYILIDDVSIRLMKGENILALNNSCKNIISSCDTFDIYEFTSYKLNNDKVNVLLCSDNNYLVGLFATLNSLIQNTKYIENIHFNFMIPIENTINFSKLMIDFEDKLNITLNKSIIYIDQNIIDPILFKSKCYGGGGHLLNVANFSRLLIGEFMEYNKLLYLDSDSIVQYDIIEKVLFFDMKYDMYSCCANKVNNNNEREIVIKYDKLLNFDNNISKLLGIKINPNDYAYMGAPFLTNCNAWKKKYNEIINIIKIHNNTQDGLYKLFTMSIQNILFYNKTGNINEVFKVLQDLGSKRKKWEISDTIHSYVIDWSGIYKPWYNNGLYRNLWLPYDIMNLNNNYSNVENKKNVIEKFN